MTAARLRATLRPREALLLLLDVPPGERDDTAVQGALLLYPDHPTRWQPLAGLERAAEATYALSALLEGRHGYRRRGTAGRGPGPAAEGARGSEAFWDALDPLLDAARGDALAGWRARGLACCWRGLDAALADRLWRPLAPHLEGVDRVACVTHGSLHLLPLELGRSALIERGARAPPELAHHPGLVFYALRRGLFEKIEPAPAPALAAGLFGFAGVERDIPFAEIEAELLAELWRARSVACPFAFDRAGESVGLFHVATHGGADEDRPERVALVVGATPADARPVLLDARGIHASRARAREVFISACVGGQTLESLDGDPAGLVSGFAEHGAERVVASLVPIPDLWAFLLALLTHQALLEGRHRTLDAALAEGKRRLRDGDWYPDTETLVRGCIARAGRQPHFREQARWCVANRRRTPLVALLDRFDHPELADAPQAALRERHAALLERAARLIERAKHPSAKDAPAARDAAAADLAREIARFVIEALLLQRIPPQPDLDTLLYGFRAFGDAGPAEAGDTA